MKPENVMPVNSKKYIYVFCNCCVPISHALRIPRVKGQSHYSFKCDVCGCSGKAVWKAERGRNDDKIRIL